MSWTKRMRFRSCRRGQPSGCPAAAKNLYLCSARYPLIIWRGSIHLNDSVVTCSDGLYTLVFKIKDNDTIVLQIPNQDGLHMSGLFIPNGTEFHYEEPSRGTLTFHTEPASANAMRADFSLDFGETIDYSEVWAEYWQDGVCTKSEPLALHREDRTACIFRFRFRKWRRRECAHRAGFDAGRNV